LIEVIGHPGSSEYEAAVSIQQALLELWPNIDSTPPNIDHVKIGAGIKITGYPIADIDIVVCGVLSSGRTFIPSQILKDRRGKKHIKEAVTVKNFIAVIEVKDHDRRGIQIVGDSIKVFYSRGASRGWHNATEQNDKQVHSLRDYLDDKYVDGLWVSRSLLMRGLAHLDLPCALPRSFTGEEFLTAIASLAKLDESIEGLCFSSGDSQIVTRALSLPIFKTIVPSGLDRKRMDLIVKETPQTQELANLLGNKMVRLRGQGGTGKTVMLLQAAWRKFSEKGARTLILTYNRALAADIRRLLTLLGVPSNPGDGGIAVNTVMSFMYSWFRRLQLLDEDEESSFEDYPNHCANATELIEAGAIGSADIQAVVQSFAEKFDFDYIMVDESQDWPQAEADLLKVLYSPFSIAIGDGVDQLVRGARTDWDKGVAETGREVISLRASLRMKSNLSSFVESISHEVGLPWEPRPNDKSGGGHLFLAGAPASTLSGLLAELTESAKSLGNAEIDFLFCVPPSGVHFDGAARKSELGIALCEMGLEIWDGVDPQLRKDYPHSKKQYRVVQYDSCRGLEGWTVVLDQLDEAWRHYRGQRYSEGLGTDEAEAFLELDEVASSYAWQRVLIALCRPIDTLVITLADPDSECARVIQKIANQKDGYVTFLG